MMPVTLMNKPDVVNKPHPLVRYYDETPSIDCPYGNVTRIITGGEGGIANVHVVRVTQGDIHVHTGYDEVYYVLSGKGHITIDGKLYPLRPGAAAVIPSGASHGLSADQGETLEFVIFGTPAMSADDPRFIPSSPATKRLSNQSE